MNIKSYILASAALLAGTCLMSCEDANEFKDTNTSSLSFGNEHPESIANTKWVRAQGLDYNAYGEEVQGFVESLDFFCEDSVHVKMSQGLTQGTWTDDSNTEKDPSYEYIYTPAQYDKDGNLANAEAVGRVEINKITLTSKGVSKTTLFIGVVSANPNVITLSHYGDVPNKTYLVKQ